jgi:hypothetical protein
MGKYSFTEASLIEAQERLSLATEITLPSNQALELVRLALIGINIDCDDWVHDDEALEETK